MKKIPNERVLEMVDTERSSVGGNQKKAATVCWTCRKKRRFGEAGARREDK